MEAIEHTAMIGVKILSSRGAFHLRQLVKALTASCELERISSVYKVGKHAEVDATQGGQVHAGFAALTLVLKVLTTESLEGWYAFLKNLEQEWKEGITHGATVLRIYLLTFDNHTLMTPDLVLPYPELHQTAELVVPAAEVWGDYIHPVLGKSLFALTQRLPSQHWGEFYAQGKSLLDF